jgi:flagellin
MSLRIQNNIEAFNAHRQLVGTSMKMSKSMEKLASGFRINRAADDAAGLAISEKLRAQVGGLKMARQNGLDAVSLVQTAEGAMQEVHAMLQRVRDLKVQYLNGTLSSNDKTSLEEEVTQLGSEIQRIGNDTTFNGITLLNSTSTVTFQVGANDSQTITVSATQMYGAGATYKVDSAIFSAFSTALIADIDLAIANVASTRATFGGAQNRIEHALANLAAYEENLQASESRIRDVDMAAEMVTFTKYQILQQAGTAMLAQANTAPQSVLSLLRG